MSLGLAIGAVVALVLWVLLAFIAAIPAGWVHIPLAVGTVLVAVAIVKAGEAGKSESGGRGKSA